MLLETTYTDKNVTALINDCLGFPFSFIKSIKLGGIGSKRMIINEVSLSFKDLINTVSDINYANIELRPAGVLVRINKGLQNFAWLVPYYKLVVYKSDGFSIHCDGEFVKFKDNKLLKENKNFIDKMMKLKIDYLAKTDFNAQFES